jgi:hypothetical protein
MRKLIALGLLTLAAATAQQPQSLPVQGLDGSSAKITVADIEKLPQTTITVQDHGKPATFEGALLSSVMASVATPTGEKFHRKPPIYYVLVDASDGYRAVFSWAELDPAASDGKIYLVTKRDGKPLSAAEGPYRIISPGDKTNGRWVHSVTSLKIKQAE